MNMEIWMNMDEYGIRLMDMDEHGEFFIEDARVERGDELRGFRDC